MQQHEGVRGRARGRDAVAAAGLQVRGGGEAGEVGRAGRGDRGLLVGAPRPHLDQRAARGRGDHPRGRRGDRAVVVEHRQHQRLQHHGVGERAADRQDRRAGEVQLALRVAVDVAGEAVAGEPVEHGAPTTPASARARRRRTGTASSASSSRPVPATTPYRRPSGSRRANTSNAHRRSAAPSASAAATIVSSYRSVSSAVGTAPMGAVVPAARVPDESCSCRRIRSRARSWPVSLGGLHGCASGCHHGAHGRCTPTRQVDPVIDPSPPRTSPATSLAGDRVERPGQPHVLRHLRAAEALRLSRAEGHRADARRAPQGQGRRVVGRQGEDRGRRREAARGRPLGHDAAG